GLVPPLGRPCVGAGLRLNPHRPSPRRFSSMDCIRSAATALGAGGTPQWHSGYNPLHYFPLGHDTTQDASVDVRPELTCPGFSRTMTVRNRSRRIYDAQ